MVIFLLQSRMQFPGVWQKPWLPCHCQLTELWTNSFQAVQTVCFAVLLQFILSILNWWVAARTLSKPPWNHYGQQNLLHYFIREKSEQQVACLINCFPLSALHGGTKFLCLLILSTHNDKRKMMVGKSSFLSLRDSSCTCVSDGGEMGLTALSKPLTGTVRSGVLTGHDRE